MKLFLFDVPILIVLGYLSGRIYAKILYEKRKDAYSGLYILFTIIFWLNALLTYLRIISPWGIGEKYCVEINIVIGIFYVLSYPLWFEWGAHRAWEFFGKTPSQGGITWFLGYKERAKPFKPAWGKAPEDRRWRD